MTARIKELRVGRWQSNRLWWWWLRCKQVYRVLITGKQGAVEVVFGVLALVVSVLLYFLSLHNGVPLTRLQLIEAASLILLVSAACGAIWALRNMTPLDYAQTTTGGRTASETLQLISLDIKGACEEFQDQAKPFKEFQSSNTDKHCQESIDTLKKQLARQHGALLKISALLDLASQQLDIPTRRLRDLLFEYDPTVHAVLAQKFVQNWELLFLKQTIDAKHGDALVGENNDIVNRARARIMAQLDMLEYTSLHPFLLRMAAPRSTAQATQEYARALSFVSRFNPGRHAAGIENWNSDLRQKLNDTVGALRFLASRQRTHSGFDLNQSCLNLIETQTMFRENDELRGLICTLKELGKSVSKEGSFCTKDYKNEREARIEDCEDAREKIRSLSNLWKYTVQQIEQDRNSIVDSFRQVYLGRCDAIGETDPAIRKRILVTHGFSTTVREVFKRALPVSGAAILPDIFVITTNEAGDLDSRLMVSALLEVPREARPFGRVAFGNRNTLAKFVESDTDVIVVLGAECFDEKGRVVHPWGLEDIEEFKSSLGCGAFSVVVVAEGYKFNDDLLSVAPFFCYHLDRIHLYDPSLIDVIISTHVGSGQYERRSRPVQGVLCQERRRNGHNRRGRGGHKRNEHILRRPGSYDHVTRVYSVAPEFKLANDAPFPPAFGA
jgi:hypothetical protein